MRKDLLYLCGTILPVFFLSGINRTSLNEVSEEKYIFQHKINTHNQASPIKIPLGGNAFITQPVLGGSEEITNNGLGNWTNANTVTSVYFRLGKPGTLTLSIRAKVPSGKSTISVSANGSTYTKTLTGINYKTYPVGTLQITNTGYYKVDLKGISKTGNFFADVSDLMISGTATKSDVVFANDAENFYWSRRGPSVHLGYTAPEKTEWFYNEITVPAGEDKIGSYFMSNGFNEGYFGIQVNSTTERRVLFSVWDPDAGKTTLVRKGSGVVTNTFGGEGTGGQSYLLYNWNAGTTYKFLTQGKPDGQGNTLFSSWFFTPESGSWRFMATWKRPNTSTYLSGIYSFLENFMDENGWQSRKAYYNNQWARTADGTWTEILTAQLTADGTAHNGQRKDYAGGIENGQFYLKNGGFFSQFVNYDSYFTRKPTGKRPAVDVDKLQ